MVRPEQLVDPMLRTAIYAEQGFDSDLTDFPSHAFDEGLRLAGLRELESAENVEVQQDGFARARTAFKLLQNFEVAVRRFIAHAMFSQFGPDWIKRQLPAGMREAWIEKREKAVDAGCIEQPLIDYADFTDYVEIIHRKDNWNIVFKQVFGRKEDVRESFQRLFPVRIATMHARLVTREDELLLLVETKRVLKAIN